MKPDFKKSGSFGDVIRQGSLRTFDFLSFFSLFFGYSVPSALGFEVEFGKYRRDFDFRPPQVNTTHTNKSTSPRLDASTNELNSYIRQLEDTVTKLANRISVLEQDIPKRSGIEYDFGLGSSKIQALSLIIRSAVSFLGIGRSIFLDPG
ncbi:hypothetical protein RhiirA4_480381 [Rhizophagus irregularis]|uniref:Uncharacterized protein n=1 Tax=Rhizophagus irregularis TaxID=588596 RepID=A0A2I1HHU2_9GLOM|nr:hypothetical protein RhiirA4_480381 [Rhizophagus irregularis]